MALGHDGGTAAEPATPASVAREDLNPHPHLQWQWQPQLNFDDPHKQYAYAAIPHQAR